MPLLVLSRTSTEYNLAFYLCSSQNKGQRIKKNNEVEVATIEREVAKGLCSSRKNFLLLSTR